MSTADAPTEQPGRGTPAGSDGSAADQTVEVVVGRVAKAHGLRGDVLVDVRTDEPERRFAPGAVLLVAGRSRLGQLTLLSARWHGPRLLVRFAAVPDRDAADSLRGAELSVRVAGDERPDDPEEYYDHQLVGLEVTSPAGDVGTVTEVLHLPTQELLSICTAQGEELLVPFVRDLVEDVDLPRHQLLLSRSGEQAADVLRLDRPPAPPSNSTERH
jgi:16S rRNA processing protein RimM